MYANLYNMLRQILDLHIHSRYSRACSKQLELEIIAKTCEMRGIDIVATGDFTHPAWFRSIKEKLVECGGGLYRLKDGTSKTKFLLGTEVASIKKHKDSTRRVHLLLFAPSIEVLERFNNELARRGYNLNADGRPILGLTCKDLLQLMLEIDERMVMIPAHAWTPWFGIFGSKGGYNSIEDTFDELSKYVWAIETGLSSDPLMNAHVSRFDNLGLISNSDAHSPQKLGREANVMQFENESDVTYDEIMRIVKKKDKEKFLYTIEFYPEEGKYHFDGHRDCKFVCHPIETKKKYKGICPVCKKPLVIGVMNRVIELADRTEEQARAALRIPYKSMVPLPEIIAGTLQKGVAAKAVEIEYQNLIKKLGTEFYILTEASIVDIERASSAHIALAIDRVRSGNIFIRPGYDGEFGVVKVFKDNENGGKLLQPALDLEL